MPSFARWWRAGRAVTYVRLRLDSPLVQRQAAPGIGSSVSSERGNTRSRNNLEEARRAFFGGQPDLVLFSTCPVANFTATEIALRLGLPFMVWRTSRTPICASWQLMVLVGCLL